MQTETTFNAMTVLQAMLSGYAVEIEGVKYAYDEESRKVGVLGKKGDEDFILFCDIDLNRFLSMCEQIAPEKIQEVLAVLQYSPQQESRGLDAGSQHFH
ncbi:hypothetical protein [Fundidesulfovibrio terrae]|uniref:hypothetical protein n=1 Tax=Fundidesulfovibrio terrae TaxID=2922866 RepID=UPI001FAE94F5|nr:hypothetical protein [Fundidesulfovibrio terrae]